ncbi:right-handed parallel beta-helix repeat-containing protein [Mucilaginibacter sp. BJC16-A38]|uniref:right-handed parallel beta-helix repeat-containing protein n=1 Tax=Mucilaginibacter phenanthrenivorans TaxID=1234842 RepID=UPI002157384E|nr:right-handed parallel beta-helix repeat-containing protein [Mucilaginibacter phenanthrenivorans]MCR8557716.1 right-handed parallel beta-helix repeat-containing protein [Mucilaginibacter phenanthrenivorans]
MTLKRTCQLLFLFITITVSHPGFSQSKSISLFKGIVITHSGVVNSRIYHFQPTDSMSAAPIIIEGDNIVVDFRGAIIQGSTDLENPNKFIGTGIIIKSGKNITLKNLTIKGFKIGLMAKGIKELKITGSDFSYNYKQHLNSTRDREDLADWQSYHHNENDEWMRYGAGIYLRDCDKAEIHDDTIIEGQCGLMMTNCNDGLIYNNNFSFNSGLGIGMYRSSRNRVLYNKLDWNVRGYSDGVYYRGQDSAGILVFEQCNDNTFAYNSVTHSGDGFFLWAGQTTMDTGQGGCNDNLLYANDFSYAPTNGIELTFSRNKIIDNIVHDCWHGIWGGFSYNTIIANNDFAGNMSTIAIEHGMNNVIAQNTFKGDKVGIELWSNPKMAKSYGYVQKRDTRSMKYTISNNTFSNVKNVFNINNTNDIDIINSKITGSTMLQKLDSTVNNISFDKIGDQVKPLIDSSFFPKIEGVPHPQNAMLPNGHAKGRKYIIMDQWGPYNFDYPIAWWQKTDSTGKMYFDVMGPAGKWKIVKIKGAGNPSVQGGTVPSKLTVQKDLAALTDIDIEMEYTGSAITSPFGVRTKTGAPYIFHYREFDVPFHWQMKWFVFDATSDPVKNGTAFNKLLSGAPVKTTEGKEIGNVFGKAFGKNIAREKIATVSTTAIDVPGGVYRIGISASEIVRVYIDDKLIIENWDPAKLKNDEDNHKDTIIPLNGRHSIRIEQAQYADYGMLNFSITPKL